MRIWQELSCLEFFTPYPKWDVWGCLHTRFGLFSFPPQPFPWLPPPRQELHDHAPNPEHRETASEQADDKLEEDEHDAETQKGTAEQDDAKTAFPVFDPTVKDPVSWEPPQSMLDFLEKHFNQALVANEHQTILDDFPKPACCAVQAPKLDAELREWICKKSKDPQFGQEKVLYKVQEQLVEVTGSLACLTAK